MKKVKVEDLKVIDDELDTLSDGDALIVCDGKEEKYAIITMSDYLDYQELIKFEAQMHPFKNGVTPEVHVLGDEDIEITYEEYESIKKQLLEALDKTFKSKLEKLN